MRCSDLDSKRIEVLNLNKNLMSIFLGGSIIFNPVTFHDNHMMNQVVIAKSIGTTTIDAQTNSVFMRGRQLENDGAFQEAQKSYEQVIEVEPTYFYAWSGLGNTLVAQGELSEALLCYKKSLSLSPPTNEVAVLYLNIASIESSIGKYEDAIKHLEQSENIGGTNSRISAVRAVTLSLAGKWEEACTLFSKIVSSADRDALPWWLRYSMSLLETSRGMEAVAYLQRTLNRYPFEPECNAFAAALYTSLNSKSDALYYWNKLSAEDQLIYSKIEFVSSKLHWGPKSLTAFQKFVSQNL